MNRQLRDYVEDELILDNFRVNDLFKLSDYDLIDAYEGCETNGYLVCPKDETDIILLNKYFDEVRNCLMDEEHDEIQKDQIGDVIFVEAFLNGGLYNHGKFSKYIDDIILAINNFAGKMNVESKLY